MGAWGTGSFENDDARDWVAGLGTMAPEDLTKIFARAADDPQYLEGPAAYVTVAAGEVVAALKGAPGAGVPAAVVEWVGRHPGALTAGLTDLAGRAVDRVRRNSELKDLWMQADGLNEWIAAIGELQGRIEG